MKKEYTKPAAEKMVFDYTESVVACSGNEEFFDYLYGGQVSKGSDGNYYYNNKKVNDDPYGQYHKCRSNDHHDCDQW